MGGRNKSGQAILDLRLSEAVCPSPRDMCLPIVPPVPPLVQWRFSVKASSVAFSNIWTLNGDLPPITGYGSFARESAICLLLLLSETWNK